MDALLTNLVAAVAFATLGILIFAAAIVILDRITPGALWREIIEEHNTALAILVGLMSLGISVIIAAAVH